VGTWSAGILGNDTSAQTYERFFELYDAGEPVRAIIKKVEAEMRESLILEEDRNNVALPLALALWECRSLDAPRLARVKRLVASGQDLEVWKGLDAGAALLGKRGVALTNLLRRISTPRPTARKRAPPAPQPSNPFRAGCCLAVRSRGRHHAFWIVRSNLRRKEGDLAIACLHLDQVRLPTLAQCERAYVSSVGLAGAEYPRGTWRGSVESLWYYPPDGPLFLAALDRACIVIGHTPRVVSDRLIWDSSGTALNFGDPRCIVRRLVGLQNRAKTGHWPLNRRLGNLISEFGEPT
jgi:hypothetical protein